MSDWSQQVTQWLGEAAEQAETVLRDVSAVVDETLAPIADAVEQVGEDFADRLDKEVSPLIEQLLAPLLDAPLDIDVDLDQAIEDVIRPWRQTIDPTLNNHPVCAGCQHYHGESYGGNMLVCGMYPYGLAADQTDCPDKADIDWQEPWKTWFETAGSSPNEDT